MYMAHSLRVVHTVLTMLWMLFMSLTLCAVDEQVRVVQGAASTRRKPLKSHPRTWTKPYIGQPSAQCQRNPGGGSVPHIPHDSRQGVGVVASAALETAQSLTERATHDGQGSASHLVSRQPQPEIANDNLLAIYYFRCPQGGAMTQLFMWGVVYLEGHENVQMIRWHNILNFAGTFLNHATGHWWSNWDSIWCVPHDKLECWYEAYGHTRGRLYRLEHVITIYLIRADPAGGGYHAPTVHEFCEEIGLRPDWNRGVSCIIDDVQVTPVTGM